MSAGTVLPVRLLLDLSMSARLTALALLVTLALIALGLVGDRRRRHVLRRQARARERLHALFSDFVDAVRDRSTSESDIERFLAETAEVNSLFCGSTLPRLRLELHDQALRLSRLEAALDDWQGGPRLRAVVAEGCEEKRAWFTRTAGTIDVLFDEQRIAPLERFNRAIGA